MTTPAPEIIVRLTDISKDYYRDQIVVHVLSQTNLRLHKGDFVAVMGPSGSGKSTLLNLLAGLDRPTSGEISVNRILLNDLSESELTRFRSQNLGFIFQSYNLMPVLTAFENVELPLLLAPLSKRERAEHVKTALNIVGLGDRMDHYPRQLSGGQEQRVAIARAVVNDAVLLLADEPTGNLDAASAEEIMELLCHLNDDGKTIVMVTHDPRAAARARRILHLDKGQFNETELRALQSAGG